MVAQLNLMILSDPVKPTIIIPEIPKTVEAQDRSPITLTIGDSVTALTNTSITIQCATTGVPTPNITWTKDGQEIPKGGGYTIRGDGSLLIRDTKEEDNGRYACTSANTAGNASASSVVQIVGKSFVYLVWLASSRMILSTTFVLSFACLIFIKVIVTIVVTD